MIELPELPEKRRKQRKKKVAVKTSSKKKPVVKPRSTEASTAKVKASSSTVETCPKSLGGIIDVEGTKIYGPTKYTSDVWMHNFATDVEGWIKRSGFKKRPVCVKFIAQGIICYYQSAVTEDDRHFASLKENT